MKKMLRKSIGILLTVMVACSQLVFVNATTETAAQWEKIYTDDFSNWEMTGTEGEASATFDATGAYMERLVAGGAHSYLKMKSMPTTEQLGGNTLSGKIRMDFTYEVPTDKMFYVWMYLGPVSYQESSGGALADNNWVAVRGTNPSSNAVQVPLNNGKREISLEIDFGAKTYTGSINGVALKSGNFLADSANSTEFDKFNIEMRGVNNGTQYGEIGTAIRVTKVEFYKLAGDETGGETGGNEGDGDGDEGGGEIEVIPSKKWAKIFTDDFGNWEMTATEGEASATFGTDGAYMERLVAGGAHSYLKMKSMPTAEQLGGNTLSGKLRLDFTYEVPTDKKFYLWMYLGPVSYQESSAGALADNNWVAVRGTNPSSNAVQVPLNNGKRVVSLEFDFDTKTYTGSVNGVALKRGNFLADSANSTEFDKFNIEMRGVNNGTQYGEIGTAIRVTKVEFYKPGIVLSNLQLNETQASVTLTHIFTQNMAVYVILAGYDAEGVLNHIKMQPVDLTPTEGTKLISAEFANTVPAGGSIKAFVWEDASGMYPLCEPVKTEVK